MKRISTILLFTLICLTTVKAGRETFSVNIHRPVNKSTTQYTKLDMQLSWMAYFFGQYRVGDFNVDTNSTVCKPAAEYPDGSKVKTATTNSVGHWFNADGTPSNSSADANRIVGINYLKGTLRFKHRANTETTTYVNVGDVFHFTELFIHQSDTLALKCTMTIVGENEEESVESDLPSVGYIHRADQQDSWAALPKLQADDETPVVQNWLQVKAGQRITLSAVPKSVDGYEFTRVSVKWYKKDGKVLKSYTEEPIVLTENAQKADCGEYKFDVRAYYINKYGTESYKAYNGVKYYIDVQEHPGEELSWEGLVPEFSYNFKDEYGDIAKPENILGEVGETDRFGKPVRRVNGEWWTVVWGSDINSALGDEATQYEAATNMVKKYDTDFAYIRDVMGWPPDIRARKGYKSTIYIFGSGLKCDNENNQTEGGYQAAIWYSDPKTGESRNWPCVWASWNPFSRFRTDADRLFSDGDYQREAMIHEGIHALFADMDGVKNSSWFHEAGNTWLQSAMAVERGGNYPTYPGFLDGAPFVAPFMPIECYSGWLQDGTFGGPQAEGVNLFNDKGQVCTWRTYLGGTQYGNSFPIILGEICGKGSIPWIWRNCKTYVLKGIGEFIGDEGMRNLIMQYRARQALFDIGGWKTAYRAVTRDYFGKEWGPEWEPYKVDCGKWKSTCYQQMRPNDADGWYAPDLTTGPGWSGANLIPMHIDPQCGTIKVQFRPEGQQERALLCYTTKNGECHYSQIVHCGEMQLDIDPANLPANNVILCVVCNTDYIYTGEQQRCTHYDYRIRPIQGVKGFASKDIRWFMNEETLVDKNYDAIVQPVTAISTVQTDAPAVAPAKADSKLAGKLLLSTGMVMAGHDIHVACAKDIDPTKVNVRIAGLQGIIEGNGQLNAAGNYRLPANLRPGLYLMAFSHQGQQVSYKVVVK